MKTVSEEKPLLISVLNQGTMAARKTRGCREPRDITVESYASVTEGPTPLLSTSQGSSKSHSTSRTNSEESSVGTQTVSTNCNSGESGQAAALLPANQIAFISGNPFVEVTKGILHLFKEEYVSHFERIGLLFPWTEFRIKIWQNMAEQRISSLFNWNWYFEFFSELTERECAADRSHTICILSVPATMTCHDLLTFTAACHQDIQHFRIIRNNSPNQYMALITLRSSVSVAVGTKDC